MKEDPKVREVLNTKVTHEHALLHKPLEKDNLIIDSILALTCAEANIDLHECEMEKLRKSLLVNKAYNNNTSTRGQIKENNKGWIRDNNYDVEMKLHVAS